ncbi:MAG TPA: ABC transporter ATP-binding protein [Arachnia sp.]|nr:ABC transporter ATP-binding protein [Arachnia sp.]HMT86444.1 ABC transporter ATP-binding protein [Arachnia sp.]
MSGIRVSEAVVRYGDVTAVDRVSFDVSPGEVLVLLGASGSGKSSILRAVAGLEPLAGGAVSWGDEDLRTVPVHKRGFGLVFQDGQLFPTMSVGKNVAYGLGKAPKREQRRRVAELLELVGLPGYEDRKITELSGGQAQRIALARSLAPAPRALLFDEPLSALDTGLRRRLSADLKRILTETRTTALYVTHDQEEAFAVADEIAVLDEGRMLQLDTPERLWRRPHSTRVAEFLGYRTFVAAETAAALGWKGPVADGEVIGLGTFSLQLADDGASAEVLDVGGYTKDGVSVEVRLPDGQRALLLAPEPPDAATVRVRLVSAAVTRASQDIPSR